MGTQFPKLGTSVQKGGTHAVIYCNCELCIHIYKDIYFTIYIYKYLYIHVYICYIYNTLYELQPKLRLMESSIRDIFIFLKLSWVLENDNTLFKKR